MVATQERIGRPEAPPACRSVLALGAVRLPCERAEGHAADHTVSGATIALPTGELVTLSATWTSP